MKAIVFLLCFVPSVAHAQFFQQPQPAQQPIIVYPQAPIANGGNGGSSGDHTMLQMLMMQQMFSQQTAVQQGWSARNDALLQQILAQQEGFRTAGNQRDRFDQIIAGQVRARESVDQRALFQQLHAREQLPPPRRGILGLRR